MKIKVFLLTLAMAAPLVAFADSELRACRSLVDVAERVRCYDHVVDSRSSAKKQNRQQDQQREQREQSKRSEQSMPDREPPASKAAVAENFGKPVPVQKQHAEVSAQVVSLDKSAHQKLIVRLDNGQVWMQLDSSRMWLQAGDQVTVRASSLNSFQLRKQGGGKSIRVRRIK